MGGFSLWAGWLAGWRMGIYIFINTGLLFSRSENEGLVDEKPLLLYSERFSQLLPVRMRSGSYSIG